MKNQHDPIAQFKAEKEASIASYADDAQWQKSNAEWLGKAFENKYMYNFSWMGRPIIQNPADMVAMQEIIWEVQPDLIVETGIAHGGSLIMNASFLAMLELCGSIASKEKLDPAKPKRKVVGVDIDIREHNRKEIEKHPMYNRLHLIEGSSLAADTISQVREIAKQYSKVLVCLDSNHTHEHVMEELKAYAPLTSKGSYCVVFDTIVEDLPEDAFPNRPWGPGDNPKTAVREFLATQDEAGRMGIDGTPLMFAIDQEYNRKLMTTCAPEGYLKRI